MNGEDARGSYAGRSVGGGRYVLRDLLGRGGMAAVHLAHDTVLDRPVAVKTLHSELGREASFRERFRREAQAVAKLNHTNIVSVFDSGEDTIDGAMVPYIVMEYVEGKPLRTVLDEDVAQFGAMPAEKALKICGDVLAALSESHSVGLVHRDIKPGNVMLTKRGVVKVMDFGIARAMQSGVTSMTQTGMVVGTPQYLSPEQALGRGVDERSDLYSVGCLLFELLTGRLPFDGDSPLSIAYQHVQEAPPAPSQFNRAVLPAVDALVARALRKNPAERFPNADAMRDESDRVIRGEQAGGGAATTPLVIGEGPRARGREGAAWGEVSSAVFPSVRGDLQTPPPQVQQPYQAPQAPQAPQAAPPVPQTPPVPHLPQQAPQTPPPYAAPQHPPPQRWGAAPAHTPPPGPAYAYPHQQTPPPYGMRPTAPMPPQRRGGSGSTVVLAIGAVVAVIAVIVVLILLAHAGRTADNGARVSDGTTASTIAATSQDGVRQADRTRTIDTAQCTDATASYLTEGSVLMPDFYADHVDSVKSCMDEAGWNYTVEYLDETIFGKGAVVKQDPDAISDLDPENDTVTIWVSTGRTG
jgi:serine/threonine protein kinase